MPSSLKKRRTGTSDAWQVFDNADRRMPIDKDEVRVREGPRRGLGGWASWAARSDDRGQEGRLLLGRQDGHAQRGLQPLGELRLYEAEDLESKRLLERLDSKALRSNPYYIVQQGKVAELTLMDDRRRLELLKEISGAGVYDERRAESMKLLQDAIER